MMSSLMISDSQLSDFFDIGLEGIATETMRPERGMGRLLHDAQQVMGLGVWRVYVHSFHFHMLLLFFYNIYTGFLLS